MRDPKLLAERLEANWMTIGEFFASRNWPDTALGRAASDLNADVPAMLAALRSERYVPPRLLDEHEVEKLARKVAMPKYMFDTSEARLYLASFFNQASIFISLPR